jgi:hypothetical protein
MPIMDDEMVAEAERRTGRNVISCPRRREGGTMHRSVSIFSIYDRLRSCQSFCYMDLRKLSRFKVGSKRFVLSVKNVYRSRAVVIFRMLQN